MTDDRPQYGEYATPEQQRAAAGLPPAPPPAPAVQPAPADAVRQLPARPAHPLDRVITAALLGFGLVNVLTSVAGFMDLATTMNTTLQVLGLEGEFTNFQSAKVWGAVAAVAMIVGYAATLWFAFRRLRAGRRAWWVPLVGFVITMALVSACVAVPMFGDPAFTQGLLTPPAG
ncbi:DUF6264 family protein [Microbacterium sp.]|uniref:DUF6264 family protein n=1 Tax=Microbacterium sp. TaxID=51671 RepID=UPI002810F496|nr:DUF6264 family protein [Microbacterium sp.]